MISTKGRYALRVMIDIGARENGGYIPLKDVSERLGISMKYLEQIVSGLYKAGLLVSLRGSTGGYRLAKKPEEISSGDILRAAEGTLAPIACISSGDVSCDRQNSCVTLPFWQGMNDVVNEYVNRISLRDLLNQAMEMAGEQVAKE